MLTVPEFYAPDHRGNWWHKKGFPYTGEGHRGDDTNGWPLGTGIPSFTSGVVVASTRYPSLGWTTTVRTILSGRTAWVSYCHEYSQGPQAGTPIWIGAWVGPLGNTGTLSLGKHVHVVVSFTSSDPRFGSTVDPRPYIEAAKSSSAGGGAVPLPDEQEDEDMNKPLLLVYNDGNGDLGPKGDRWVLYADGLWNDSVSQPQSSAATQQLGIPSGTAIRLETFRDIAEWAESSRAASVVRIQKYLDLATKYHQ